MKRSLEKTEMIKYYRYAQSSRITGTTSHNSITGQGMIIRYPMSPDEMDEIINDYLKDN